MTSASGVATQPPNSLEVQTLRKTYRVSRWPQKTTCKTALDSISLTIPNGGIFGLIGRSGSGKSTFARCLAGLEEPDSGSILIAGLDIATASKPDARRWRKNVQLVLQHSATSLNSRFRAWEAVAEPLHIQASKPSGAIRELSTSLLLALGLPGDSHDRNVTSFSGGQRQRIALARALILEPKLIIFDESFAGLDHPTRTSIIYLLREVHKRHSLTYLFITHDIKLAADVADTIAIVDRGRIVESGNPQELLANPKRPETRELIESIPPISLSGTP
jgi:peptide/nickel transport system ATP-binding protein